MKKYARFAAVLLCGALLIAFAACAPREKEVVPAGDKLYPSRNLEELSEDAAVILHGTISSRGQTIEHVSGTLTEVFTETILDVIEVVKSGDAEIGETYTFRAWGGETDDKIYLGVLEFEMGDEVLIFLNEHDVPCGPGGVYFIQDGETTAEYDDFGDDLPQTYAAEGVKPSDRFALPAAEIIDYIKAQL